MVGTKVTKVAIERGYYSGYYSNAVNLPGKNGGLDRRYSWSKMAAARLSRDLVTKNNSGLAMIQFIDFLCKLTFSELVYFFSGL